MVYYMSGFQGAWALKLEFKTHTDAVRLLVDLALAERDSKNRRFFRRSSLNGRP